MALIDPASLPSRFTEDDLLQALRDCFLPALRRDVVSAGLVQNARLQPDPEAPGAGIPRVPERSIALLQLRMPSADPAVAAQVQAAVENRLLGLPSISRVELTWSPPLFSILPPNEAPHPC